MSRLKSFMLRYRVVFLMVLVAAWAGALVLTHLPPARVPEFEVSDKVLHRVGFAGLTTLFVLTLLAFGRRRVWRVGLAITALPVYAALDEWTQPWFRRTCDIHDWLADMTGMLAALVVLELLISAGRRISPRKAPSPSKQPTTDSTD